MICFGRQWGGPSVCLSFPSSDPLARRRIRRAQAARVKLLSMLSIFRRRISARQAADPSAKFRTSNVTGEALFCRLGKKVASTGWLGLLFWVGAIPFSLAAIMSGVPSRFNPAVFETRRRARPGGAGRATGQGVGAGRPRLPSFLPPVWLSSSARLSISDFLCLRCPNVTAHRRFCRFGRNVR